jgi:hypothetical protein
MAWLTGCTDPSDSGEHVWKSQTDTMDRARGTEQLLDEARVSREQQIDAHAQ